MRRQVIDEWTVDALGSLINILPECGCWVWTGQVGSRGYGRTSAVLNGRRIVDAHRLAYTIAVGPVPEGLLVCHRCDVRVCVNPDHLWLGTNADNMRDMGAKGRNKGGSLVKFGLDRPAYGENSPSARLTDSDALYIRHSNMPGRDLAEKFGISKSHVYHIRGGQKWRHLLQM